MPPKMKQPFNPMTRYLSGLPSSSSSSSSSAPLPTYSPIDLTSSPPLSTTSASTSDKGGKTSYIWNHGKKIIHEGKDRWQCDHCGRSYAITGSATTNQREHLNTSHGIADPKAPIDIKQSTLNNYRRPPIRLDVLRKLIVEWIIERRHSFNETESEALHKIFEFLDPRSTSALMSARTIGRDITKYFETAKVAVKERLSLAQSRIHISYDLWTSPNQKAMIAIVAHWTTEDYEVKSALLAIRELHEEHTGPNIANVVYPVLKEYDIHTKFGFYIGDNATNNDKSLRFLNQHLHNDGHNGFDIDQRRLCCFAHEMQLATKALLFGPNVKELEEYSATANATEEEKQEYMKKKWRSFGAVGKLHNTVKFIRGSPQRREAYSIVGQELEKAAQKKLKVPVMDNDTRWGSVMDMVEYGLDNRAHLELYCLGVKELEHDRLTEEDWLDLQAVTKLLKPFRILTKMGQEKNSPLGSIGSVLWGFDMLLEVLENTRKAYKIEKPDSKNGNQKLSHLATCIDHAHGLFSKYYELTDKTEAYVVAMVLDPRQKYKYFFDHWERKYHAGVKKKTETMYKEFRIDSNVASSSSTVDSQQSKKRKAESDDDYFDIIAHRFGSEVVQDELERYLKVPPLVVSTQEALSFDLIAWWRANEMVYLTLARMAYELYSIPSMSAEVERVFSRFYLQKHKLRWVARS